MKIMEQERIRNQTYRSKNPTNHRGGCHERQKEKLYGKKFYNLRYHDKLLETYAMPKMNNAEREYLNRSIASSEIKTIKIIIMSNKHVPKTSPGLDYFAVVIY